MYIGLHVQYLLFLSDFNEACIFSTDFRKDNQTPNLMKILPVGAEFVLVDGQTDSHDAPNSRFSKFCGICPANLT
jgi:hypothetical protein